MCIRDRIARVLLVERAHLVFQRGAPRIHGSLFALEDRTRLFVLRGILTVLALRLQHLKPAALHRRVDGTELVALQMIATVEAVEHAAVNLLELQPRSFWTCRNSLSVHAEIGWYAVKAAPGSSLEHECPFRSRLRRDTCVAHPLEVGSGALEIARAHEATMFVAHGLPARHFAHQH